jgi:hypothetical protein
MAKKHQKQPVVEDIRSVRRSLHRAEANLRLIPVGADVCVGELAREFLADPEAEEPAEFVWYLYYRVADITRYEAPCFCAELFSTANVGGRPLFTHAEPLLGSAPTLQRQALRLLPGFLMQIIAGRGMPVTA